MIILPRRHIDPAPADWRRLVSNGTTNHDAESVQEWEGKFAEYIGCRFGIAVGSGRLAMKLLLASLELPEGAEIIIPAYTLKDLIPIITSMGLVPVAADIDPDHWNISATTVEPVVTKKTRAIIVLHLFGNPAPIPELRALAMASNLKLIEDCAHSAGSTLAGKPTGSFGSGAFFSFESIKPVNTFGGGMVLTDDLRMATRIREESAHLQPFSELGRKLRAAAFERMMFNSGLAFFPLLILSSPHGQNLVTKLYRRIQPPPHLPYGYSGLQAELGIRRLSSLAERVSERQRQAARLTAWLPDSCRPQQVIVGGLHNYYFFVVRFSGNASRLRRRLLMHRFDVGYGPEIADDCSSLLPGQPCNNASILQRQALHLPLHEEIGDCRLERLAEVISEHSKRY